MRFTGLLPGNRGTPGDQCAYADQGAGGPDARQPRGRDPYPGARRRGSRRVGPAELGSALISVGQIGAVSPQVDSTLPLQAIAAVLSGGTSLFGGAGGVGGTALGVILIELLQNGLSSGGIPSFWQQVVTGAILVLAVGVGTLTGADSALLKRRLRRRLGVLRGRRCHPRLPGQSGSTRPGN